LGLLRIAYWLVSLLAHQEEERNPVNAGFFFMDLKNFMNFTDSLRRIFVSSEIAVYFKKETTNI
jgi:hypothetical protein